MLIETEWTPDRDALLSKLWARQTDPAAIGRWMGITCASVRKRIDVLALSLRCEAVPKPIPPNPYQLADAPLKVEKIEPEHAPRPVAAVVTQEPEAAESVPRDKNGYALTPKYPMKTDRKSRELEVFGPPREWVFKQYEANRASALTYWREQATKQAASSPELLEGEWRQVVGWEDLYEVSDRGRVKSLTTGFVFARAPSAYGYAQVHLVRELGGENKTARICRLVADAFVPNPENKPFVNHIDHDRLNDLPENLEWVTRGENNRHGMVTKLGGYEAGVRIAEALARKYKKEPRVADALLECAGAIRERIALSAKAKDVTLTE